jgi:hypothetical protein
MPSLQETIKDIYHKLKAMNSRLTNIRQTGGAGGDNDKVAVDAAAAAGFLGTGAGDGVLRTGSPLTYADGGDFVTLDFAHLGFQNLAAPPADRILFWDDTAGALKWLELGTSLNFLLTVLNTIQGIRVVDAPTFDDLTLNNPVNIYALSHNSFANWAANKHVTEYISDVAPGPGDGANGDLWFEY